MPIPAKPTRMSTGKSPARVWMSSRDLEKAHLQLDNAYREHKRAHDACEKAPSPEAQAQLNRAHEALDKAQDAHDRTRQMLADAEG